MIVSTVITSKNRRFRRSNPQKACTASLPDGGRFASTVEAPDTGIVVDTYRCRCLTWMAQRQLWKSSYTGLLPRSHQGAVRRVHRVCWKWRATRFAPGAHCKRVLTNKQKNDTDVPFTSLSDVPSSWTSAFARNLRPALTKAVSHAGLRSSSTELSRCYRSMCWYWKLFVAATRTSRVPVYMW